MRRSVIAAILGVAAALVAVNMLGVAAAEAPAPTPVRTVSVEGVAEVPVAQGANRETATAAYRQGMAAAISDGHSKAEYMVGKAGGTLGAVQSIAEDGGSIECTEGEAPENYARYEGQEPDFGSVATDSYGRFIAAPAAASATRGRSVGAAAPRRHRKKRKAPAAKKASYVAATCTLSAQVVLVYQID
jgi:hypothetical protein